MRPLSLLAAHGAQLLDSAADDEQADTEAEDDDLEGDSYGVLKAALQLGRAGGGRRHRP
jgi:hypothetical protein